MGRTMEGDGTEQFAHDYGANRLLAAKRARKRAEGDYQLLQNRLVRLRLKEEKAQKKISETKKRAEEILALKARNEMANREKMNHAHDHDEDIAAAKDCAAKQRVDQRLRCQHAMDQVSKQKRDGVLHARRARQEHEMVIQRQRDADLRHAQQCKDAIKAHEVAVQQAAHKKRIELTEKFQEEFDNKVMQEERQRTIAEAEVRRMESEEAFLIDRLKATQEEQRTAYDQLESALNYDLVPEPEY